MEQGRLRLGRNGTCSAPYVRLSGAQWDGGWAVVGGRGGSKKGGFFGGFGGVKNGGFLGFLGVWGGPKKGVFLEGFRAVEGGRAPTTYPPPPSSGCRVIVDRCCGNLAKFFL